MSPFEIVSATRRPARADKTRLIESSRRIEARALTLPAAATTMWVSLQRAAYLSERTAWVYRTIAALGVTVHLYAPDAIELDDAPSTLHTHVTDVADWAVLLLGERAGWGLVARDRLRYDEPEDRRSFDWAVTRDRICVAAAAGALRTREPLLVSSASGSSAL